LEAISQNAFVLDGFGFGNVLNRCHVARRLSFAHAKLNRTQNIPHGNGTDRTAKDANQARWLLDLTRLVEAL
jgi:hypothetical protein